MPRLDASLFVLLIGLAALAGALVLARRVLVIRGWPTAQASVIERGVGESEQPTGGAREGRFVPRVRYTFDVEGRRVVGSGLAPVQETMSADEARRAADAVPERVLVHYDPTHPETAYLESGSLRMPALLALFGALLTLGALLAQLRPGA